MKQLACQITLLLLTLPCSGEEVFTSSAKSAILVNARNGALLWEKNADEPLHCASLTKVATALYTLARGGADLHGVVTVPREAVAAVSGEEKEKSGWRIPSYTNEFDGTHIGLKTGEKMMLKDLLAGMMICSGNDASNAIAYHIGGSIPLFIQEMNRYLQEIGCTDTYFTNPHGLYHPDHHSTARDLMLIASHAMRFPLFRQIVSSVTFLRPQTNKQKATTLLQGNRLLRKGPYYYQYAVGIKTGWTSVSNSCLIAAAEKNGRLLIAVLLGCKNKKIAFRETKQLFETAFAEPMVERRVLQKGEQKYATKVPGCTRALRGYLEEDFVLRYYLSELPELRAKIYWESLALPIRRGEKIGEVRIVAGGEVIGRRDLLSVRSVEASRYRRWLAWLQINQYGVAACIALLLADSR